MKVSVLKSKAWKEDNPKILKVEYLSNHWPDLSQSLGDQTKIKMLETKTTSNGRRPQNIKSGISQQPLIGSFSNLKLKLRGPNQIKNGKNKDNLQ